ncbi:hypothetical protein EYC80_002556 [Monilinia laxa]|uniref:Uncharacterized protein n=1 Tax=Monilinia laxa TaxID=61186 RepID=A0A5N6K4D3_MONLA|nr:hypothetical protein EYC80_002556 [Monilinia laxa]
MAFSLIIYGCLATKIMMVEMEFWCIKMVTARSVVADVEVYIWRWRRMTLLSESTPLAAWMELIYFAVGIMREPVACTSS